MTSGVIHDMVIEVGRIGIVRRGLRTPLDEILHPLDGALPHNIPADYARTFSNEWEGQDHGEDV